MWYRLFRIFFTVVLRVCFKFEVDGAANLPQKTNFIVVANHSSWMDPVVIGVAISKRINFIAMRDLYKIGWLKWFVKLMGALPTGASSEKAACLLNMNRNIGLFPEGGCSPDGSLRRFRRGAALLAIKTGRPVVPCAILGTFQSFPREARFPKPLLPVKVKIGKPIYLLKEPQEVIDDVYLQEGTFRIRNSVKEMINAG